MACHDSSRRPQPRSGSIAPATVYTTVSRSGLIASPCSTMSSPVLTIAVTSPGGTARTSPASRRAAPTPPHSTETVTGGRARGSCDALELPLEQGHVRVDHQVHKALEAGPRLPAEHVAGLGRVADEQVDLGGPEELLVDDDVLLPVEAHALERELAELPHRVGLAGGDDVVVGRVLLQHQPHGLDVVARVAPVALGVEVAEPQLVRQAELDLGDGVGDLAGHELEAAAGALVVEEDAAGGVQVVGLAVVDGDPVPVDLGHAVGRAGVER